MATRLLTRICVLAIILGTASNASMYAQSQKYGEPSQKDYPWQKGDPAPDEEDQEEQDQGGYQAPPPTGAMQGATREFGLSGGEIELPAIRLRLPRVRFPSLSMFLTPPRMHTERGVAPMVQQVQNQISVPTGATPQTSSEDQTERNGDKGATQKGYSQHRGAVQGNAAGVVEFASMRGEMEEFENRLDNKLAVLAAAIEQLANERAHQVGQQRPINISPKPLPVVNDSEQSQVRQSSYVTGRRIGPTPSTRYDLRRLPATPQESTTSVLAPSAPRMLWAPAPGAVTQRYR